MTSAAPVKMTTPLASTYDQGTDVQPAVSWSNPNKDAYPTTSSSTTTTTTSTTTSIPSSTTPASTTAALERNLNPLDKEDPRLQTKALPFSNPNSADIAASVQSPVIDEPPHHLSSAAAALHLHNGNILDRTMDQIRGWVQSFHQPSGDQYEEYVEEVPSKGTGSTVDAAKARLNDIAQQTSSTLQQVGNVASDKAAAVSSTVRAGAGELQTRVGDAVHVVSDRANATVQQVKSSVNEFIAQHQSQPGEPLGSTISSTISNSIGQQLPSQAVVKEKVSALAEPLAQQASSSSAFLGSFVQQYLSTYRDFFAALRRQSLPLQAMTGLLFVTHFVLPLFFFEKGSARSVIYCYVLASLLSHLTFFLSGHLRYLFLAHLVFVPMLISLTLHAGFGEASQANAAGDNYDDGNTFKAMLYAPLSLRSYLFVLWLRLVLMVQASLLTLDAVNVLDLLGFSLETRRGQEMALINRSVAQMRRNFAHQVSPPTTSNAQHSQRHTQTSTSSSTRPSEQRQEQVVVQSHEQQPSGMQNTEGLRERKAVHPTYYINNQRV